MGESGKKVQCQGTSCVFDAISSGIDVAFAFAFEMEGPVYPSAKLRVILLSNGTDEGSQISFNDLKAKVIDSDILLDAVLFRDGDSAKEIAQLCHCSGGSCVLVTSNEQLDLVAGSEAFLSVGCRVISKSESTDFDSEFPNLLRAKAEAGGVFKVVESFGRVKAAAASGSRSRRIMKELRRAQECDPNIRVFVSESVEEWRVFIKGPDGSAYENKWWYLYVTFHKEYPRNPPIFKFISVPFHPNISREGKICLSVLDLEYKPCCSVILLIVSIRMLFASPNFGDPIHQDRTELFQRSPEEFWIKAREWSETNGKNSLEDWINGLGLSAEGV
jgi:ubiquitin-conjugating enzyme (huntingtin interacting protein 2)